jgi:single-strand DNA-binding protein
MSSGKNRVHLIGRLGAEPEVKTLESGSVVAKIRLATSEWYTNNKGERVEDTQWHTVMAWNKLAEKAREQLVKGSEVSIEGKIQYREYTTTDGHRKYVTEIMAFELSPVKKEQAA